MAGIPLTCFMRLKTFDPNCANWRSIPKSSRSAKRLFGEVFSRRKLEVEGFGNVFVATAFLYGLAQADISEADYTHNDEGFEIVIGVRAGK